MSQALPEVDAYPRYRLSQGDPGPIVKRIAAQEASPAVGRYLENQRLLEMFKKTQGQPATSDAIQAEVVIQAGTNAEAEEPLPPLEHGEPEPEDVQPLVHSREDAEVVLDDSGIQREARRAAKDCHQRGISRMEALEDIATNLDHGGLTDMERALRRSIVDTAVNSVYVGDQAVAA